KRSDGQINPTSQNDWSHCQRKQADFAGMPQNVAGIIVRAEIAADRIEENPFRDEHEKQYCLVAEQVFFPAMFISVHPCSRAFLVRTPSATTASKMINP